MSLTFLALLIGSCIFFILAVPLVFNKIRPNNYYGVRLPITFKNPEIWFKINKIFGISMIFSNFIFLALVIIFSLWKEGNNNEFSAFLLFLLQLIIPVLSVTISLFKLKREQ